MNRLITVTAFLITAFAVSITAEACNRCGIFGRGCHFAHQQVSCVQAAPAAATNASTNFVFNNTFPTPYLLSGQQGSSVYGYSLASAPYHLDANLFMDRAARFTELALQNSDDANKAFAANTAQAMALNDSADRRTKNTLLALSAIQANSDPNQTQKPLSFQATVTNGRLSIRQIEGGQSGSALTGSGPRGPTGFALGLCSKCHDGSGKNGTPQGFSLDGSQTITQGQYDASIAKIKSGEMPPPSKSQPLTPVEAVDITAALCGLKSGPILPAQ